MSLPDRDIDESMLTVVSYTPAAVERFCFLWVCMCGWVGAHACVWVCMWVCACVCVCVCVDVWVCGCVGVGVWVWV